MNERYINYICKQKSWFITLSPYMIDYRHKGEANDIYLCHMVSPKIDIDRIAGYSKIWRFKGGNYL